MYATTTTTAIALATAEELFSDMRRKVLTGEVVFTDDVEELAELTGWTLQIVREELGLR